MDDGALAIIAGADTTSSAVTALVYCLLTHSGVYDRLQAEIDRFYPPGEDPTSAEHHREMPYLTAVMYAFFSPFTRPRTDRQAARRSCAYIRRFQEAVSVRCLRMVPLSY